MSLSSHVPFAAGEEDDDNEDEDDNESFVVNFDETVSTGPNVTNEGEAIAEARDEETHAAEFSGRGYKHAREDDDEAPSQIVEYSTGLVYVEEDEDEVDVGGRYSRNLADTDEDDDDDVVDCQYVMHDDDDDDDIDYVASGYAVGGHFDSDDDFCKQTF